VAVVNRGTILLVNHSEISDKKDAQVTQLGQMITTMTTNPIEKVVKLTDPKTIVDGSEVSMTAPDTDGTELRFILDKEKFNSALNLFAESVMKPDHALRQCSHNQKCYHELMYVREYILEHLNQLRR
tara:strand:+ start:1456 stop:1836 length:381 start_codon:yes stop_codon:yes gene_type:complete